MDPVSAATKIEVRIVLPVPEIIAGTVLKNFGQSLDTPFKVIQGH